MAMVEMEIQSSGANLLGDSRGIQGVIEELRLVLGTLGLRASGGVSLAEGL